MGDAVASCSAIRDEENVHNYSISSLYENKQNRKQTGNTVMNLNTKLEALMAQEKEFRKVVLQQLIVNNDSIEGLTACIDKSLLQIKIGSMNTKRVGRLKKPMPILEKYPIEKQDDLLVMEDFLRNPANVEALIRDLSRLGGSNLKEVTKRMCFAVVDDQIAIIYSWDGAKE